MRSASPWGWNIKRATKGKKSGWKFLHQFTSGMAGKKGRNNLPPEPSDADPHRLHLVSPQNNHSDVPSSALRERFSECLQRSFQEPCIMGESFAGKNFRWKASEIGLEKWHFHTLAQSRIHTGVQSGRKRTPKGEKPSQSLWNPG